MLIQSILHGGSNQFIEVAAHCISIDSQGVFDLIIFTSVIYSVAG